MFNHEQSIFSLAKNFQLVITYLNSAQNLSPVLANFITTEKDAILLEVSHRLMGGESHSFGEFDEFINGAVEWIQANQYSEVEKTNLIELYHELTLVLETIKEYGYHWLPDRIKVTGKAVAITLPSIALAFEPLRAIFVTTFLRYVEDSSLVFAVISYLLASVLAFIRDVKLLKINSYVVNPYITILALKLKPEWASILVRVGKLGVDLSVITSAGLVYEAVTESEEVATPLIYFLALWILVESLGNTVIYYWLKTRHLDS